MIEKYKLYYRTFLVLFWGAMCWGFVTEEWLTFLDKLENVFFLGMDVILLVLGLCLLRTKKDFIVLLSYTLLALFSTCVLNQLSVLTVFNGSRDFFGLLFMVPVLTFFLTGERADEFKAKFDRQLKIWLFIQAFCVTWQFVRHGANDWGGGSMGWGASGMVSMLIYLISYYLSVQNWDFDDYVGSLRRNKWNIILLYPTFLNETKISFVLLVMYFVLLYRPSRSAILKFVYVIPVIIGVGIGLINVYLNVTEQDADEVLTMDFIEDYFFGLELEANIELALMIQDGFFDDELDPDNPWILDIQRIAKLQLITEPLSKTEGGLMFGAGLGQFKGGTMVDQMPFMRTNKWLLQGSRPWLFTVFVQLGFAGLIWFFTVFAFDCYTGVRRTPELTRMYVFLTGCLLLMLVYNEALRYYYFCAAYFYLFFAIRRYKPSEALTDGNA